MANPLWANLCIQRGTAGDTTGEEEDEFSVSVLHGRWLQTQEDEQRLWEEGEHCVMHIHNHLIQFANSIWNQELDSGKAWEWCSRPTDNSSVTQF